MHMYVHKKILVLWTTCNFLTSTRLLQRKKHVDNRHRGNKYSGCGLKIGCGATKQRKCTDDKATCCQCCPNFWNIGSNKDK